MIRSKPTTAKQAVTAASTDAPLETKQGDTAKPSAAASFADPATQQATGAVASKGQHPTHTVVGVYEGRSPITGPTSRMLEAGFAADRAGNADHALDMYKNVELYLKRDIAKGLPAEKLAEAELTAEMINEPSVNVAVLKAMLTTTGLIDDLAPTPKKHFLQLLNRTGLAHGHKGDNETALFYADMALQLDPDYGAARYNEACAAMRLGYEDSALNSLAQAIADPSFDFKALAKNDTDWNGVRDSNDKFRALVS